MTRNPWTIAGIASISLVGVWVYVGLYYKQVNKQSDSLHEILDEVEQDMGTYDPESARDEPAVMRAMKVSKNAQLIAERKRREMDSLASEMQRLNEEEMGNGYLEAQQQPPSAYYTEDGVLVMTSRSP